MIKFWKQDFRYIKRYREPGAFLYIFAVTGESCNYLINKYNLNYPEVNVSCINGEIFVNSHTYDKKYAECCDCDENDIEELYSILKSFIDIDMINWNEYIADDFYTRDDRWE